MASASAQSTSGQSWPSEAAADPSSAGSNAPIRSRPGDGRETEEPGVPVPRQLPDRSECLCGEQEDEVGLHRGAVAGDGVHDRHGSRGDDAGLDGEVGDPSLGERHPHHPFGSPAQTLGAGMKASLRSRDVAEDPQSSHAAQRLEEIGAEGLVAVPVVQSSPGHHPLPHHRPGQCQDHAEADDQARPRVEDEQHDHQDRAGNEDLHDDGDVLRDMGVRAVDAV